MLEIIVILAVSMILLPFVAILCDKDQQTQARGRGISVVILGITLVWLIYVLFFAGVVVSSPHTWLIAR